MLNQEVVCPTPVHKRRIYLYLYLIRRSSNRKELIWIKANKEKKVDKVLPGNIFILMSFKEKVFTQINSQQMNTFRSSSPVDCAI